MVPLGGPRLWAWQIDCGEVHGWDELEMLCARGFNINGQDPRVADAVAMDSANGNMRVKIQEWCSKEPSRRLILRGSQVMDVPWRKRASDSRGKRMLKGVNQYYFDSTAFKTALNDRLHGTAAAPPWYLPQDAPDYMLRSLTSEEQVPERKRLPNQGWREILVWQPRAMYDERGGVALRQDNHWWDCETMALVVAENSFAPTTKNPVPVLPAGRRLVLVVCCTSAPCGGFDVGRRDWREGDSMAYWECRACGHRWKEPMAVGNKKVRAILP